MTAEQQRDFIKNNLGLLNCKSFYENIVYDHNCDKPAL
jgi:hypothetical protein